MTDTPPARPISFFHPAALIATFFGVGKIPVAPGTFGSIATFPFMWLMSKLLLRYPYHHSDPAERMIEAFEVWFAILVFIFVIGTWAAHVYVKRSGKEDPGEVVIDEVVGQGIVLIGLTPSIIFRPVAEQTTTLFMVTLLVALALFRYFDIKKPWPINWCDSNLKGGFGVMFDDVVAGVMATVTYYVGWLIYLDYFSGMHK